MKDLIERLRAFAADRGDGPNADLAREAADEIERLALENSELAMLLKGYNDVVDAALRKRGIDV